MKVQFYTEDNEGNRALADDAFNTFESFVYYYGKAMTGNKTRLTEPELRRFLDECAIENVDTEPWAIERDGIIYGMEVDGLAVDTWWDAETENGNVRAWSSNGFIAKKGQG